MWWRGRQPTVAFSDNTTVSAEIKGIDPSTDLAVIRVALSSIDSDIKYNQLQHLAIRMI